MSAADHIRYLAEEIGPRGSATAREKEAACYAADVLRDTGLKPNSEPFTSAVSAWYPYSLAFGLILVGVLPFWIGERWGTLLALTVTVISLSSVLLELAFSSNPLRWILPKARSQNVWATLEPEGPIREQVVLVAHLDTHRTPLVFSSDTWVRVFRVLIPVGLAAVVLLTGLLIVALIWPSPLWHLISLAPTAIIGAVSVLTFQADRSPHSVGANDNASGVGVVLDLARRAAEQPLENTLVWFLLSGCEEVGCYGANAFCQTHRDRLNYPIWLTIDNVGGGTADPTWLEEETFLLTARSDPDLLTLAESIARHRPDLKARSTTFHGAYTEGATGARHGFRVLTLVALTADGMLPDWHRSSDVMENVDLDAVERSRDFVWEFLRAIDDSQEGQRVWSETGIGERPGSEPRTSDSNTPVPGKLNRTD